METTSYTVDPYSIPITNNNLKKFGIQNSSEDRLHGLTQPWWLGGRPTFKKNGVTIS